MIKIIVSLFFILSFINANEVSNNIGLFFKIKENKVQLKWIPQKYSNLNTYKIYKTANNEKEKLISTVKAKAFKELKKDGFSEDYIFSIYPFKNVKSIDEQLKATLAQKSISGFRILRFMQDNEYAKNLGQFYEDNEIKSLEVYKYRIELFQNDKLLSQKEITINKNSKPFDSIAWLDAEVDNMGVKLFWDNGREESFFNIYRKLDNESRFRRINKNSIYVPMLEEGRKKELFLDTTLKENQNASYKIRKLDFFGEELFESQTVKVKRTINRKAKPLSNVSVYNTDTKKTIKWEKRKDALGFNIYNNQQYNGKYKKLNKKLVKKNYYIHRDFKINENSYYYVTAVTMHGESAPSRKILSYARDVSAPKAPKNLKFSTKEGKVILSWDEVKEKSSLAYKVYVSMQKDQKEWSLIEKNDIKTNSYTHIKPKAHSRFYYYYKVTAIDKKRNESPSSNIVKVKLPDVIAPNQPSIKKYKTYAEKIVFDWQEVYDYDLSHYNIYTQDGKNLIKLNKKPLKVTYFELKNSKYNGLRKYIVTAVDKSGNESLKEKHMLIKSLDLIAPKIEKINYSLKGKNLEINFTVNDKDYNGFEVFRSSLENPKYTNVSGFKEGTSYINKSLSSNRKYFYFIKVYDKVGNVRKSDIKEILWRK